jgi:hypothetical protein
MNIKRAFLAAAAVLMMPGLALAQSTNTFDTSIAFAGVGEGEVEVTLTCNSGFPLSQTASTPVNFSVSEVSTGAECSIVITGGVPSGFEILGYVADGGAIDPTGCNYTIQNGNTVFHTCAIAAEVTESDFNVFVDWTISPDADPDVGQGTTATVRCQNVLTSSGLTTIIESGIPAGPDAVFPITVDALANPIMPYTVCDAVLENVESAVAVDESQCGSVQLVAGSPAECTIIATAFFEGIPTLSQYGMAIMALLMLGVGFVGFRRFV